MPSQGMKQQENKTASAMYVTVGCALGDAEATDDDRYMPRALFGGTAAGGDLAAGPLAGSCIGADDAKFSTVGAMPSYGDGGGDDTVVLVDSPIAGTDVSLSVYENQIYQLLQVTQKDAKSGKCRDQSHGK